MTTATSNSVQIQQGMQEASKLLGEQPGKLIEELRKVVEDSQQLVQKHVHESNLDGADDLTGLLTKLGEELDNLQQSFGQAGDTAADLAGRA